MSTQIVEVALPVPMRRTFDYLVPSDMLSSVKPATRVLVPFGSREHVGVVLDIKTTSDWEPEKLKPIIAILDAANIISDELMSLLRWASQYYCHPIGDVIQTALPSLLRKGATDFEPKEKVWCLADSLKRDESALHGVLDDLKRAKKQRSIIDALAESDLGDKELRDNHSISAAKTLLDKGYIYHENRQLTPSLPWHQTIDVGEKPYANPDQAIAISTINRCDDFSVFLIEGVTGSGKTEVYLQAIESRLEAGKQVLVMVPEISLTPQTVKRFEQRFSIDVGTWHSGMTDNERLLVWHKVRKNEIGLVIGTRSSVFLPFCCLSAIIIDEEHDSSLKQQDGFRYHARDLAIMRAKQLNIPLVLGSATPSFESLNNALNKRYQHLFLHNQAVENLSKSQHLLDLRRQPVTHSLSDYLLERMSHHLSLQQQVMVFLNRRGYAPAVECSNCGYIADCHQCDKPMTLHNTTKQLHCHHCGTIRKTIQQCPSCGSYELITAGVGTEKIEEYLTQVFPDKRIVRIDSDSTRNKSVMAKTLDEIAKGKYDILIGTQILAKGHHFPNLSMVAVLDVDNALFSADFRGSEQLAQLIVQIAGRVGRSSLESEMWLQTYHPDHPVLQELIQNGYGDFARLSLNERQAAHLPPYDKQVLIRAEAQNLGDVNQYLFEVRKLLTDFQGPVVKFKTIGPFPALMEKRGGRFRMQLLLSSAQRQPLHAALHANLAAIEQLKSAKRVRWSIDVDPIDFF